MTRRPRRERSGKGAATPAGRKRRPASGTDPLDGVGGVYLAVVAFLAGASVMIVELAASRVLAPQFGNTLYTWTALIGVILVALSGGYYAGGRLADRYTKPIVLLHLVAAASLFVLLVPVTARWVTGALAPEGRQVDVVWGPLAAAVLLFALPGCLLGTVSPFAVKLLSLRTHNERVGTSAGTVAMLSTAGSVLGTFAAGFVLIPSFGIRTIFVLVGLTLAVAAAWGYAGLVGRSFRSPPAAGLLLVAAALSGVAAHATEAPLGPNVVFQTDTFYHRVSVLRMHAPDGRAVHFLLNDGAAQGAQAERGERLVYGYNAYYRLERLFCPSMKRAAFLGGGAYAMPQSLADDHPNARIDVVEIDPEIERIGRRFFRLDDYAGRVRPVTGDARAFLAATDDRYDLIFGDVFRGRQTVPPHLATREFFDLVKRRLTDDGVYMMNLMGALEGPRSPLFSSVAATLRDVFPELYVFVTRPDCAATHPQNLVLMAPKRSLRLSRQDLVRRAGDDRPLAKMADRLVDAGAIDLSNATVFTDDYCPVEYLVAGQLRE